MVEFLKVLAISVAGFILVSLLVEITDKIKYYFEYNPPGWLMLKYFLVKIPGYLFHAIPLGMLLGGMLSLLMMARNSEIIAMQANGIDALSVARPLLVLGAVMSVTMLFANETVIPWSNRYSEYIQDVQIAKKPKTALFKSDQIWMRSPRSVLHVGRYDTTTRTLERVCQVFWDAGYDFTERVYAEKAKWWGDHWVLYGVNRTVKQPDGAFHVESLPLLEGMLDKNPSDFQKVERPTKEMNLWQLSAHIDKLEEEGQAPTAYIVDWHDKIAFPFVCLIMSALSVPFAVRVSPRGGGVATGLAVSLAVAFSYWLAHALFIALGHGGYLPGVASAWGANVLFGLTAAIMLLRSDT